MPELPEVETIKRGLKKKITGNVIEDFKVLDDKVFNAKKELLIGKKIKKIERKAKIIVLHFHDNSILLIHLKMTGQLVFDPSRKASLDLKGRISGGHPSSDMVANLPNKHTRAVVYFKDKSTLYFNDMRRFGYIKYYKQNIIPEFEELGIDALDKDMTGAYLWERARGRKIEIKKFIMDQKVISGVGNIYSDEALFCARISPKRRINRINKVEFEKIANCLKEVLRKGLKHGGTSSKNYVNTEGQGGNMQNFLNVYGKKNEDCPLCQGKIKRVVVGGRSAHYCPSCQK